MKTGWLAATVVAALLLASCGGANGLEKPDSTASGSASRPRGEGERSGRQPELQPLELTLAGPEGPESAGILMADRHGYFADAGLGVDVLTPGVPAYPVKYVLQEIDDLGVTPLPQLVLAREKGFPIVAVGSLIPRPTATMIWLRSSGIHRIGDLKGKTIAIPGLDFQKDLLGSLLARAGLTLKDVEVKTVQYKLVPSLVSGRADAIFGGSANIEGLELESRGLHPVVAPVRSLRLPSYDQLVVIAREDRVARDPEMIRRFLAAVRRGTAAAIRDPEAAVEATESSGEPNVEASPRDTEAEVEATLPLLSRSGRMSPARARRLIAWMHREGLTRRTPPVSSLLTNRYLPNP